MLSVQSCICCVHIQNGRYADINSTLHLLSLFVGIKTRIVWAVSLAFLVLGAALVGCKYNYYTPRYLMDLLTHCISMLCSGFLLFATM